MTEIEAHADDYRWFVEEDEKFDDYVDRLRCDGEWGGQIELMACSRIFNVDIIVHQEDPKPSFSFGESNPKTIELSFHGEEHYNAVVNVDDTGEMIGDGVLPTDIVIINGKKKKNTSNDKIESPQEYFANEKNLCHCGSGLKYRKCCRKVSPPSDRSVVLSLRFAPR